MRYTFIFILFFLFFSCSDEKKVNSDVEWTQENSTVLNKNLLVDEQIEIRLFLEMHKDWDITLFHYRNHGSAFGRVLVGINLGNYNKDDLFNFLQDLGYKYSDETENKGYSSFLK